MRLKKFVILLTMALLSLPAFAQVKVTGVVTSADDGLPVIGATVLLKGNTSVGTATDIDGRFTLNVPSTDSHLVISYVGMNTKEVKVSTSEMEIVLDSDSQVLQEVVVTGMGKMDKRLFTGSTTQISAEDAKLDGVADISRSLEGKAAGVSVQNVSGTFGTAPKIRVRGATSIMGASKPLWVVDGVVMEDAVEVDADDLSSGDAVTLISSAILSNCSSVLPHIVTFSRPFWGSSIDEPRIRLLRALHPPFSMAHLTRMSQPPSSEGGFS